MDCSVQISHVLLRPIFLKEHKKSSKICNTIKTGTERNCILYRKNTATEQQQANCIKQSFQVEEHQYDHSEECDKLYI